MNLRLALAYRVVVIGDFCGSTFNDGLWAAAIDWLMHHTFWTLMTLGAFLPLLALWTFLTLLALGTFLTLGELLLAFRQLLTIGIVAVAVIALIVIANIFILLVAVITIVALILDRRLSLSSENDSIVVLGVLEIVFSYHAITGALCITCKRSVFFGDVLSVPPDFNIGAVALIVAGKWVGTFVAVIVVTASAHAPILLYWPHTYLFSENQGR